VRHDGESAATSLVGGSGAPTRVRVRIFQVAASSGHTAAYRSLGGVIRTRWLSALRRGGGGTASVTGGRRAVGEAGGGGVAGVRLEVEKARGDGRRPTEERRQTGGGR
jgi:hypothetical protein